MREIGQVQPIGWLSGVRRSKEAAAASLSEMKDAADAVCLSGAQTAPASRAVDLARRMAGVGTLVGLTMIGSLVGVVALEASTSRPELKADTSISVVMDRPARPAVPTAIFQEETAPLQQVAANYPVLETRKGDYVANGVNYSSLISDEEFTDTRALSRDQIQLYLMSKSSVLADFSENGRRASDIIADAAQKYEVNPRVLMATLEKEASLLSRESAGPRTLKSAMGYAYTDGGGSGAGANTFAAQVEGGASLLHDLYEEGRAQTFPVKKKVDFGKRNLQINNAATWALMRYTPHTRDTSLRQVGGGNYLFRNVLERLEDEMKDLHAPAPPDMFRASNLPRVQSAAS